MLLQFLTELFINYKKWWKSQATISLYKQYIYEVGPNTIFKSQNCYYLASNKRFEINTPENS